MVDCYEKGFDVFYVNKQSNDIDRYCDGCAACSLVCPNYAIKPEYNPQNKFLYYKDEHGAAYRRRGRRNDPQLSTLDRIKFTLISMLTEAALDAGRHEFRVRTLLRRILPPEELPLKYENGKLVVDRQSGEFIPPVREIFPIMISSMSVGALSPSMWEGLRWGSPI